MQDGADRLAQQGEPSTSLGWLGQVLTRSQNSEVVRNCICGGMKRGRCPLGYLGTGSRGCSPRMAMPTKTNMATAQILSVHRKPYRSSNVCSKNGNTNPTMRGLDMSDSNG